jgi:hypothetical protein
MAFYQKNDADSRSTCLLSMGGSFGSSPISFRRGGFTHASRGESSMRVLKFDRHRADVALREIGFNIEEGGVAKITGDMTIRVTRPSDDSDSLLLEIKLPNGHLLDCKTSCAVVVDD